MERFNAVSEKAKETAGVVASPVGEALDALYIRDAADAVYDTIITPAGYIIPMATGAIK
jgi:hypothetical protein